MPVCQCQATAAKSKLQRFEGGASLSVVPLDLVPTTGAVIFPMLMRFRSMAMVMSWWPQVQRLCGSQFKVAPSGTDAAKALGQFLAVHCFSGASTSEFPGDC